MTKIQRRQGFILITSLLVTSILLAITIPYVSRVATEYKLMAKIYNSNAALDLAEAGIERTLWEISYNNNTFSGWTAAVDNNGNQLFSTSVNSFQATPTWDSSGNIIGDYDVNVIISVDGMTAAVTGTGYVPNRTSPDARRIIKVQYTRHNFKGAVVALNGVTMSGQAKTDSYDSNLGPYALQPHTQDGDVITNGAINLSGQAYINGDAHPGPDYPFSGTPTVSGSYGTLQAPFAVDAIPVSNIADAQINNNNSNLIYDPDHPPLSGFNLSVSGDDSITLPGGTYYFTSISVTGQATINVEGPSTIYVDGGNVNISGQGIINNGRPRDLLMYSTGSSISLSGQAVFTGAIYAPTSTVTLTGQENLYGAIVCGLDIDSGQAAIHFDLDLLSVTPVFANNRVTSWQEMKQ